MTHRTKQPAAYPATLRPGQAQTDSMPISHPPLLGFAAYSGTGKTTLLTRLIPILKQRDLQLGVIKYSHHDFEIDHPGKDSYRLRVAGATPVMVVSPYRRAVITEFPVQREINLQEQLDLFPAQGLDLILVEGFRHQAFSKIELHRPLLGKPLIYPGDSGIIAVASDLPLQTPAHIPCLDLNDPDNIARFIIDDFLQNIQLQQATTPRANTQPRSSD